MDFTFNDEQQQFADALRRYLDKSYGFEARQAIVQSETGVSDAHWTAFTELGLTALPVPEAQGGFNGSPIDMLVVMQELGRALVVEPYWATAVGVEALRLAGTGQGEDASLLERAAQGEIKLAVAFHEPHARYDLFEVETVANGQGDQQTLTGTKSVVLHGAQADYWIVPARLNGEIALFVVARDAAGVKVTDYRTIDGQRAATLEFNGTPARQLAGKHAGAAALEHIADYGTVLLCAEAVGALDALNHATRRVHQNAPAVRPADRAFSGLAASHGRDVDSRRAGAFGHVSRGRALHERRRRRTSPRGLRGEGAGRSGRPFRRSAGGSIARRHGRHE